jgi:hypothetical protein
MSPLSLVTGVAQHPDHRTAPRLGRAPSWHVVAIFAATVCIMAGNSPAVAQEAFAKQAPTCEALLDESQDLYVAREFTASEELIRSCLSQPHISDSEALRAYRLLALVLLRQDDLPQASQAVLRLLGFSFEYEPDPILDPPIFVSLVAAVKDQIRLDREQLTHLDPPRQTTPAAQTEGAEVRIDPDAHQIHTDVRLVRPRPERDEPPVPIAEHAGSRVRSGIPRWLLIGGGVAAAGVVGIMLSGGGSTDGPPAGSPLPPPPSFPR